MNRQIHPSVVVAVLVALSACAGPGAAVLQSAAAPAASENAPASLVPEHPTSPPPSTDPRSSASADPIDSSPADEPPAATAAHRSNTEPLASDLSSTDTGIPEPENDGAPRIGSIKWYTFIYEQPVATRRPLGGIRIGSSTKLKSNVPVPGRRCNNGKGEWFELEPFGYVCSDDTTTRSFDTPLWRALSAQRPRTGPNPYHYAYSMGAPMYNRVPTEEETKNAEWDLRLQGRQFRPMGKWAHGHERLVDKDPAHVIQPNGPTPKWFENHGMIAGSRWNHPHPRVRFLPAGSGVAWNHSFEADGRTWLITPELQLVPADRVFAYAEQTFHGVELKGEVKLPLAWIRTEEGEAKYQRQGDGTFASMSERWPKHAYVLLTGVKEERGGDHYWQTREGEVWLKENVGATVVQLVEGAPYGTGETEHWLDTRIGSGWAVAYEGMRPVWTTQWSPGKGGVPVPGERDHIRSATTEMGTFSFQWKEKVAIMSPDSGTPTIFWFADVPHIQYVKPPLALHVSYWHEDYGRPMSAECMNFSPLDAAWLFEFTTPHVPEGWNAIRANKDTGPASRVVIRGR